MHKLKNVIKIAILILLVIFIVISPSYSTINTTYPTKQTGSPLEIINKGDTIDKWSNAAAGPTDDFFNFRVEDFMYWLRGGSGNRIKTSNSGKADYKLPGVYCCEATGDGESGSRTGYFPHAVVDLMPDGIARIVTLHAGGKYQTATTSLSSNPAQFPYIQYMAYAAIKAKNNQSWKRKLLAIAEQNRRNGFWKFKGFTSDTTIDMSSPWEASTLYTGDKALQNELKQSMNKTYRARFIWLTADGTGQDMFMFAAKEMAPPTPSTPDDGKGSLKIIKVDANNTSKKLANVVFTVRNVDTGKTWTITTNSNGEATLTDLDPGSYAIKEVSNPDSSYEINTAETVVVINKGDTKTITVTIKNSQKRTEPPEQTEPPEETEPPDDEEDVPKDLIIEKVNQDDHNIKLKGVEFTYRYQPEEGASWETATAITDSNGRVTLTGAYNGIYYVTEINNPYYGYIVDSTEKEISSDGGIYTWENKQQYTKLCGYVWLDLDEGKQTARDDFYTSPPDKRINGIPVRLMKGSTVVKETTTSQNNESIMEDNAGLGSYLFEDVNTDELNAGAYHIEFDYNGMKYTNVIPHLDADNGSKAIEGDDARDKFNDKFKVIEGDGYNNPDTGYAKDEVGGSGKIKLPYDISEPHKAKFLTADYSSGEVKDYDENGNEIDGINKDYAVTASTEEAGYKIPFKWGDEIVRHNNLGICERQQPDLALAKDIQNVLVGINGYNHVYNYADRFNDGSIEQGYNDVGVKFGSKFGGSQTYSRAIYESDYKDPTDGPVENDELEVYITYMINIRNQATDLTSTVNQIVEYYDPRYEAIEAGTSCDTDTGKLGGTDGVQIQEEAADNGYKKAIITCNLTINPEDEENIFVRLKLSRENVEDIIEPVGQGDLLPNVAEIYSYSTIKDGKPYAGVDVDSNPGDSKPAATADDRYEDDIDVSPAMRLVRGENRALSGYVFLDRDGIGPIDIASSKERLGNGIRDDGEPADPRVNGVKVTMYVQADGTNAQGLPNLGDGAKVWNTNNKKWDSASTTTDSNGYFEFDGYIPNKYVIIYTWGGQTYILDGNQYTINVYDYKSTIYSTGDRTSSRFDANSTNPYWYKDETICYSDAIDDWNTRKDLDKKLIDLTYQSQDALRATMNADQMTSSTLGMDMGIELQDLYGNKNDNGERDIETNSSETDFEIPKYVSENIDFGIVRRPKQDMTLRKMISHFTVQLANGQVIANVNVTENPDGTREFSGVANNVIYLQPTVGQLPANGLIRLELDNELIQSAQVTVTYEYKATNTSETDRTSYEYYAYASQTGNYVQLLPTNIIDHLDKDWSFESDAVAISNDGSEKTPNNWWKVSSSQDSDSLSNNKINGYTSNGVNQGVADAIDINDLLNKETVLNTIAKDAGGENENLHYLDPGDEVLGKEAGYATTRLVVFKKLTTTDEIELNNEAEIINITRNDTEDGSNGSLLQHDPGDYVPHNVSEEDMAFRVEHDDSTAETVIITPNTGANLGFIVPLTVLIISSLGILVAGIILIKKKVLGN